LEVGLGLKIAMLWTGYGLEKSDLYSVAKNFCDCGNFLLGYRYGVNLVFSSNVVPEFCCSTQGGAFDSAKNHKRQRRKRQSVTAKREKSQTPKFV